MILSIKKPRAVLIILVCSLLLVPFLIQAQSTSTATTTGTTTTNAPTSPAGEWKPRSLSQPTERPQVEAPSNAPHDQAKARMTNLAANMSTRMERTVARLEQIVGRLQSRISLIEAAGGDVTEAQTLLGDVGSALGSARNRLINIDAKVAEMVGSPNPSASWSPLRDNYVAIREDITRAHTSLVAAVTALKSPDSSATSTTP